MTSNPRPKGLGVSSNDGNWLATQKMKNYDPMSRFIGGLASLPGGAIFANGSDNLAGELAGYPPPSSINGGIANMPNAQMLSNRAVIHRPHNQRLPLMTCRHPEINMTGVIAINAYVDIRSSKLAFASNGSIPIV